LVLSADEVKKSWRYDYSPAEKRSGASC
jgi:hypothetical protein